MTSWKRAYLALACVACVAGCGSESVEGSSLSLEDNEQDFAVDAKGTYLRTVWDRPAGPTVIALVDIGAEPGETLRLRRKGSFKRNHKSSGDGLAGVFSSTDELAKNPSLWGSPNRVTHAIEAGEDVVTAKTFFWRRTTDIPEDFEITDSVEVVVPTGARYLFVTPLDDYFLDNKSQDLAVGLTVICPGGVCDACEGVICNDENVCTRDACNPLTGGCESEPIGDGSECDFDGMPGRCMGGTCADAMLCKDVVCDDGSPCTEDGCNPLNGECETSPVDDGANCDADGLPGLCTDGVCEAADLCAGSSCGDANACTTDTCNPLSGACENAPVDDGTACNFDGLPGLCAGGVCGDAKLCENVPCDDGNPCTDDSCDPLNGTCVNAPVDDGALCDFDGLPGLCSGGVCGNADLCEGVVCDDGNACTDNPCDSLTGECAVTAVSDGTACDFNGLPGLCTAGVCEDAKLCEGKDCNDGNPCTDDSCQTADGSCEHVAVDDGSSCDFGGLPGLCTGGVCDDAKLCEGKDCNDGNPCTEDSCEALSGDCNHSPVTDGSSCNFNGAPGLCNNGLCEDAELCSGVSCDDGNACTEDSCDPADGQCDFSPVTDGSSCDFGGFPGLCTGGVCEDAQLCGDKNCDDGNACTTDSCNPLNGDCVNEPVTDGDSCDFGGFPGLCTGGVCDDAKLCDNVSCDDGNACTDDSCDPMNGQCDSSPVGDGASCDFGGLPGLCNGGTCEDALLCEGTDCDDGNACTEDACDPQDGLCDNLAVPSGSTCDFNGFPGLCNAGACEDAELCKGVSCNDGNPCTDDSCDPLDGLCDNLAVSDGSTCDFNGLPGLCNGGTCEDAELCKGVVCDDGNACTVDVCDPQNGSCGNTEAANGTPCAGGSCQAGQCVADAPDPQTVNGTVNCTLPLGLGTANVEVQLEIAPAAAWTNGATVDVAFEASTVIPASLGQLLVDLGTDQLNIESLQADLSVGGGSPATITVTQGTATFDVDANDDGTAEDLPIQIPVPNELVTDLGAASVSFTISHFEASLTGVPLLGSLVVSEQQPPSTIDCSLSSTTASFAK